MFDIITFGSNTLDVFVKTDSELIDIKTKNSEEELIAYPLGSKIMIRRLDFMIGGGGTNTAVCFSRLGLKTGYLGKIGRDENGLKIFKLLKNEKVEFLGTLGDVSGYSIILDSIANDRTILTYRGCNDNLRFEEINRSKIQTKWLYCSSMIKTSFQTLKKIVEFAKKEKINVAFNINTYLANKGFSKLKKILENIDVFILNKEEAELIAGKGEISDLIKRIMLPNMKYLIITDGKKGAYCCDGTIIYQAPVKKVSIKETTGAGDAFASTFVVGIIMKQNIRNCLKMSCLNAESVIQNYGAKNILLKKNELLKKLQKDKRVIKEKKL
ncbi:MAG: carbohydrate kinase family protein [Nanoarchaeota archaeon]|nr:carbohydrate kinase family protein [Nanoarchaeota archaeon]MBU1031274.1 carbohydrate kinase family protein [Nanoarchaeota archaeon]MBU1849505.1 carbohydrate kinase family protein [Nanoarchaeota archaeon]